MMNGGNQVLFSRGIQISNINGNINKKEYNAMYDGNKGKMILNDNGRKYYIEADDDDIHKLLNQPKSSIGIERKLKNIVKNLEENKKELKQNFLHEEKKSYYTVKRIPFEKKKKRKTLLGKNSSKRNTIKKKLFKKKLIKDYYLITF